jgi:hypothetical protein
MKLSLFITLVAGKVFPNNIHRANYYFIDSKKTEKKTDNTTVLPLGGIVYRKKPLTGRVRNLESVYVSLFFVACQNAPCTTVQHHLHHCERPQLILNLHMYFKFIFGKNNKSRQSRKFER